MTVFIEPISPISNIGEISKANKTTSAETDGTFKNLLKDLIQTVNETDYANNQDIVSIASGNIDDLHNLTINSEKAEIAILTAVQVRNKILDAYKEIMNITL